MEQLTPTTPLPRGVRFGLSLALLGGVMFALPSAAPMIGLVLVLGALLSLKANAAAPVKAFFDMVYGG